MVVLYEIQKDEYGVGKDDERNIADFDNFKQCLNFLVSNRCEVNVKYHDVKNHCYRRTALLNKYKIFQYKD